jgi:cysteinyl-tRNA synthetase
MSLYALGEQIDIHGGGADLIFPHHENEIAQSEGYTGKPFAQFWLHCALLQMGGEKMSKSVGNIVSIAEPLERYGADAFRMFVLTSHYRSPSTYTEEAMEAAKTASRRLRDAAFATPTGSDKPVNVGGLRDRFAYWMDNDLNTAEALSVLFDLAKIINRGRDAGQNVVPAQETLRELAGVLGFTLEAVPGGSQEAAPFIDLLVTLRTELRAAKQYQLADRVRDGLVELGVELNDGPEGTTWRM